MLPTGRRVWTHFVRVARPYFVSEARGPALGLLATLVGLLLSLSALNVVNSYVARDFMTAITERRPHDYYLLALGYLAVFTAATAVGGLSRFTELTLGLRWRAWLTRRFVQRYLTGHAYYRLGTRPEVDNPDQRISEDVKTYTTTTLSFLILLLNSVITVVAFSGVLWSISPRLVLVSVLYPLAGTAISVFIGRRLVPLNNLQLQKEADFRFELVHVREQAKAITLVQAEGKEEARLLERLERLVGNYRVIIAVLRNLRFFTEGYNYLTQLIPVLLVAPFYLRGEVEFGVIPQAAMAFSQVFNAFSLIVQQFQDLSAFAAVVGRLGVLDETLDDCTEPAHRAIEVVQRDGQLAYEGLTLRTPRDDRPLIRDLNLDVPHGRRVLLTGPNGAGKTALFRATLGVWDTGSGRIVRPDRRQVLFLPQIPYMIPGTLRDQFFDAVGSEIAEAKVRAALHDVGLEALVHRVGGLDTTHDWATALSAGEQQLIAFARLLAVAPPYAFLDHATSSLSEQRRRRLFDLLAHTSIAFVCVGERQPGLLEHHHEVVEIREDGSWKTESIQQTAVKPA